MEQMVTVNDMLRTLQSEIHDVKTGKITEGVGRVVFRGRALQLKTAELNIRYLRLVRRENGKELRLLADGSGDKAKRKT